MTVSEVSLDHTQITRWLAEMVATRSVNPDLSASGTGEGELAAWLVETCQAMGLSVETQLVAPNRPNVIARWRGRGDGRSLLITGHTDTVGVENMTGDPFDGRIQNGHLFGRGSYDMKGGLAAALGAVAGLQRMGYQPAGDVVLGFVIDEEYASIGMDALVERVSVDAALLVEPTDGQLVIAHKGFAWVTLTVPGRAAHGSRYDLGTDAITMAAPLLAHIRALEAGFAGGPIHPLLGRPSVHASLIHGGLGWSTFPDLCTLKAEHRLLPDQSGDDALALWSPVLDASHASATLDLFRPGYEIASQAPIVKFTREAVQQRTGSTPTDAGIWAWMDSAVLAGAGIPTVIYGPKGIGAHAAVESVELASVFTCAAIYADVIAAWCG